jgi:Co/Zn/Cd efflux system component
MLIMCFILAVILILALAALRLMLPGANSDMVFVLVAFIGTLLGFISMHYLKSDDSLSSKLITPRGVLHILKCIFKREGSV